MGFPPFLPNKMYVFVGELPAFWFEKGSVPTRWKNKLLVLKKTAHSRDHTGFPV